MSPTRFPCAAYVCPRKPSACGGVGGVSVAICGRITSARLVKEAAELDWAGRLRLLWAANNLRPIEARKQSLKPFDDRQCVYVIGDSKNQDFYSRLGPWVPGFWCRHVVLLVGLSWSQSSS